jgi:hypothetical protein
VQKDPLFLKHRAFSPWSVLLVDTLTSWVGKVGWKSQRAKVQPGRA